MNWYGGGLVVIVAYAGSTGIMDPYALLTESSIEILTESGNNIDIEH